MTIRVVFDTNILLSALLSLQGAPFRCLALARLGSVESVTCAEILDEFTDKLQTKFTYPPAQAQAARQEIVQISSIVAISRTLRVVAADPKDDMVIECAVVGGATHIVTGDRRHLLPLQTYQGIDIINVATLLQLVTVP